MKLGAVIDHLRTVHGIRVKPSRIHHAIADGRLTRPDKDSDDRYDFGSRHVAEMVRLWGEEAE